MSKKIDISKVPMLWEPMKYNVLTRGSSKRTMLDVIINSKSYLYSEKKDGNYGRFIHYAGQNYLQSRAISKKTGDYGDLAEKVLFMDDLKRTFSDTTVIIGEIYYPNTTSKEVGTILRCLTDKAIKRQEKNPLRFYIFDCFYFDGEDLTKAPMKERVKYLEKIKERITSNLIDIAVYKPVDENFYADLERILNNGGEGVVAYKETMIPCEGRTSVLETIKIKKELEADIDAFITKILPPTEDYTGKDIENWKYWKNIRTNELIEDYLYSQYINGGIFKPVTKSYFYGWPGSIEVSVYDLFGKEVPITRLSNLSDYFHKELKENPEKYLYHPVKLTGMMITTNKNGNYSIRHPKLIDLRDDINIEDCTMEKMINS